MKKIYSEKEDLLIYEACNTIRAGIQMPRVCKIKTLKPKALVKKGTKIHNMIINHDWENLFLDKSWIQIVQDMKKINRYKCGIYKKSLFEIKKLMPKELGSIRLNKLKVFKQYLDEHGKNKNISFTEGST